jgi:hypothetical protein
MADAKARLSIEESIPNLADTDTHRPEKADRQYLDYVCRKVPW